MTDFFSAQSECFSASQAIFSEFARFFSCREPFYNSRGSSSDAEIKRQVVIRLPIAIRFEESPILYPWYQPRGSISSRGCFLQRPFRLCGETQAPENKLALIRLLNAILRLPVPIVDGTIEYDARKLEID